MIDRLLIQSRSILTRFSFVYKFNHGHSSHSLDTHTYTQNGERSYTYIHPLFFFNCLYLSLWRKRERERERRCENNNLSRMFGCVSEDMLRSYYRQERQRTHPIHFFLLESFLRSITTTVTRLHYFFFVRRPYEDMTTDNQISRRD